VSKLTKLNYKDPQITTLTLQLSGDT